MGEHPESLSAPTYPLYKDPRCVTLLLLIASMHSRTWGVENGIGAALACRFDGLAVLASTISTSAVEMVKKHNLVKIFPLFPSRLIPTAEVDCMDWQQWGRGDCGSSEEGRGGRSHCGLRWTGTTSRWSGLSENAIMCALQHLGFLNINWFFSVQNPNII